MDETQISELIGECEDQLAILSQHIAEAKEALRHDEPKRKAWRELLDSLVTFRGKMRIIGGNKQ